MNNFFKETLPLIVVISTFIGTMISIYFTRRNLKTTKYIETITSERIKWINITRNEIAEIISNIHLSLCKYYQDIDDKFYDPTYHILVAENNIDFASKTSVVFGKEEKAWSLYDFLNKLYLFKLRLNPNEDSQIINILDYFIGFYTKTEDKTAEDIKDAKKNIDTFIEITQVLLKQEWDKVKLESMGVNCKLRRYKWYYSACKKTVGV